MKSGAGGKEKSRRHLRLSSGEKSAAANDRGGRETGVACEMYEARDTACFSTAWAVGSTQPSTQTTIRPHLWPSYAAIAPHREETPGHAHIPP